NCSKKTPSRFARQITTGVNKERLAASMETRVTNRSRPPLPRLPTKNITLRSEATEIQAVHSFLCVSLKRNEQHMTTTTITQHSHIINQVTCSQVNHAIIERRKYIYNR